MGIRFIKSTNFGISFRMVRASRWSDVLFSGREPSITRESTEMKDVQDSRIIIEDTDSGDTQPLQRKQFETFAEHVSDSTPVNADGGFAIERLPPEAEPYAAVLAIHPRYVIDEQEGTLIELDEVDESAVLDDAPHLSTMADTEETTDREEPEVPVYADMLLLIDANHNPLARVSSSLADDGAVLVSVAGDRR